MTYESRLLLNMTALRSRKKLVSALLGLDLFKGKAILDALSLMTEC